MIASLKKTIFMIILALFLAALVLPFLVAFLALFVLAALVVASAAVFLKFRKGWV